MHLRFVIAAVVVLACVGAWQFAAWKSHQLRYDGVYFRTDQTIPLSGSFWRFYPDRRVVLCECAGDTPAAIAASVDYSQSSSRHGTYQLRDGWVDISLRSESGESYYSGEVQRSHIDFASGGRHEFMRVQFTR